MHLCSHSNWVIGTSFLAAVACTLALAPETLAADSLSATRGEIVEKSHSITLMLSRGHARMRVVREVTNRGERHDQALFMLHLPEGAVATGLRTRGMRKGRAVWYEGELLEAELAARRYRELTGLGGYYPKDPALLSWRSRGELALQVFPCPPKEDKGVGYDLTLPTEWVDGRERLVLDDVGLESSTALLTLRTDVPGARLFVDGRDIPAETTIELGRSRTIELQPPNVVGTMDARLAAVAFGPERNLVALRFDAPKQISQVPRGAYVVVALDASRSLDQHDIAAEMRAAGAYLSHFESRDAKVALVAYDRSTHDLTRGFIPTAEARARLAGQAPTRANGSAVDAAVARAATLFAQAPAGAPRRLVVFGDLRARAALEPGRVSAPRGTTMHLATIAASEHAEVYRDDESDWAILPRSTGGLLYHGRAPATPPATVANRELLEDTFLELARPVRVDRMVWRLPGVDPAVGEEAGVLEEGDSIAYRAVQAVLPANATLEGELWSMRFQKKVFSSAREGKLWSALVFGTSLLDDLSEPEMNVLARAGRAVSPVTSYLAIEPGVRPSTEGLEEGEGSGEGIGLGRVGALGHGSGSGSGQMQPNFGRLFASIVQDAVKACGGEGRTSIIAETTSAEVVDVDVSMSDDSSDTACTTCVREAVWSVELPDVFSSAYHEVLHVKL